MSAVTTTETLPGLLLERAATTPDKAAIRFHQLGIWEQETWATLARKVRDIGNGLALLGVKAGDVVGIVSQNRPAWIMADLAAQGLGASTIAVDPAFSPGTVITLLQTHGASTVVVGDQEQFDKIAESRSLLPHVQRIIVVATRGLRHLDRRDPAEETDGVTTWARLMERGGAAPDVWAATAAALDPDRTITTEAHVERRADGSVRLRAHPSTSRELLAATDELRDRLGAHQGDELHPTASFADPLERALSEALALRVGAVLNIGEGGELHGLEARDVQPTIAHVPADRLREIRHDVERRRAKRGIRRFAIDRLLRSTSTTSRSASFDVRVMQAALGGSLVAALAIHRVLVDQSGALRAALVAALMIVVGAVLIGGGFAVRPFVRKAYGLSRTHSLLTSPDADTETIRFLGALHLHPILERRAPTSDPGATS